MRDSSMLFEYSFSLKSSRSIRELSMSADRWGMLDTQATVRSLAGVGGLRVDGVWEPWGRKAGRLNMRTWGPERIKLLVIFGFYPKCVRVTWVHIFWARLTPGGTRALHPTVCDSTQGPHTSEAALEDWVHHSSATRMSQFDGCVFK